MSYLLSGLLKKRGEGEEALNHRGQSSETDQGLRKMQFERFLFGLVWFGLVGWLVVF